MANKVFYKTSIGWISIEDNGKALTQINFEDAFGETCGEESLITELALRQLEEFFAGKRKVFALPLSPEGTEFMQKVWQALASIPYGEVRTYGDIAKQIGAPKAYRAVGMACNRNPLPIIVPCHRVIGANGRLVGYAGGLETKATLLALEKTNVGLPTRQKK